MFGGYAQPFNTIADMSQLIARESWPANGPPGAILYFCGPMSDPSVEPATTDHDFPIIQQQGVRVRSAQWVRTNMDFLLPRSVYTGYPQGFPDTFDFGVLYNLTNPQAMDAYRFDAQFWRANIDPSELYVLSLKGSTKYRLRPGRSGFKNLKLAATGRTTDLTTAVSRRR